MANASNTVPSSITAPNLATPAPQYDQQQQLRLGQTLRLFFNSIANLCNYLLINQTLSSSGTVTFLSTTTAVVSFTEKASNTSYQVALSGNAAGFCWVNQTDKTTSGFIIHCSVSNSNSTDWMVIL
jgi:hypothetical protein